MADDNSQLINTLMGMLGDNPQEKINAVLNSLSVGAEQTAQPSAQAKSDENTNAESSADPSSLPDLSKLLKMQGLISQLGGSNDERAHLLMALKPFLSSERKPHVDRALQLLKLTKLAEAAKEMDLLKDFKL